MFLEDAQIDLSYSCDAIAREWSVHSIADQGVCLFVGTPFASPSTVFQIDAHPDHAQAKSGSRFERRADDAFSRSISHNLRISGEIRQFGTISLIFSCRSQARTVPGEMLATHCCSTATCASFSPDQRIH